MTTPPNSTDFYRVEFRLIQSLEEKAELAGDEQAVAKAVEEALASRVESLKASTASAEDHLAEATKVLTEALRTTQAARGTQKAATRSEERASKIHMELRTLFKWASAVARGSMSAAYAVAALVTQAEADEAAGKKGASKGLESALSQAESALKSAIQTLDLVMQAMSAAKGAATSASRTGSQCTTLGHALAPVFFKNPDKYFPLRNPKLLPNAGGLLGDLQTLQENAAKRGATWGNLLDQALVEFKSASQDLSKTSSAADSANEAVHAAEAARP